VLKAEWLWRGGSCVVNDPFGAPGSTLLYVCLAPAQDLLVVVLVGLIWTARNLQERMAKALDEFKFCCLGKHFYGT
jgi:hypothetical protein